MTARSPSPIASAPIHAIGNRTTPSITTEIAAAVSVFRTPRELPVYARMIPMNPKVIAT